MRRLILRNFQPPGDIVMLTAAVRDLHRAHFGDDEPGVEMIDCDYAPIHRSSSSSVRAPATAKARMLSEVL